MNNKTKRKKKVNSLNCYSSSDTATRSKETVFILNHEYTIHIPIQPTHTRTQIYMYYKL